MKLYVGRQSKQADLAAMEWDPRKSRLTLATYVCCCVAVVLSLVVLLILAVLLLYYASFLIVAVSNRSIFGWTQLDTTAITDARPAIRKPNIILITADDLGWNDVSFHGYSEVITPNLDRLAHQGVVLNGFYAQYLCTPSRSALLTGKYPIRHGLQHWIVENGQPRGVPAGEKFLPQYLKELGYSTHMVGKWNVGYYQRRMLPTNRGFDSFFGFYGSGVDYYNYTFTRRTPKEHQGFDLWNGTLPAPEYIGQYVTHVLNDAAVQRIDNHDFAQPLFMFLSHFAPHAANGGEVLQAPQKYIYRFPNITHEGRRKYAAMVSAMDDSVGYVFQALERRNVSNNTIIVFLSDNGGGGEEQAILTRNETTFASNWPLRGAKCTQFEGGVRVAALAWSPLIRKPGRVSTALYHVTDLLPTFVDLAGGSTYASSNLDGHNIWASLSEDLPSPRTELLIQADATAGEYAFRWNQYKVMSGLVVNSAEKSAADWYEPSGGLDSSLIVDGPGALRCGNVSMTDCDPNAAPCLFDVVADPCERNNIATDHPDIVDVMMAKLAVYNSSALPSKRGEYDKRAETQYHNGLLAPWED